MVLGTQFIDNKPTPRVWFLKGASGCLTSGVSKTYISDPWTAAIGDFNKDGYGDIAVGLPDNNDGKGIVSVWRGTSSGPSGSMTYNQASSGVSGSPEADWAGPRPGRSDSSGCGGAVRGKAVSGEVAGAGLVCSQR